MLKLIQNEWMKLWSKKATWVMLIITITSIVILLVGTKWISSFDDTDKNAWKLSEQENVTSMKASLADEQLSKSERQEIEDNLKISQYRLDNNLPTPELNSTQSFLHNSSTLLMFTSLFSVIVAAGIVAFEFGTGSIKMLLTRPIARWKILLSKLLTSVSFSIVLGVITLLFSVIFAYLFFSNSGAFLEISNGKIVEESTIGQTLIDYLLAYGDIIISLLFAFMLGSLFNSSALAIGLTLFISFFAQTITMLLAKYTFIKFFWFSVSDLSGIANDYTIIEDLTMGFAITILLIYAVIFITISFIRFNKRDITA
ncbi:MAG: ABC transporter permease [Kurthia sp.]|nr:ABC transporter permease [Candidatus Kurthia equi]